MSVGIDFMGLKVFFSKAHWKKLYTVRPKTEPGASSRPMSLLTLHIVGEKNVFNTQIQGIIN